MPEILLIEQRIVPFNEDNVIGVLVKENERENVYIVLRPLVENLGLDWSGQAQRIKRDEILNEVCITVGVTPIDIKSRPPTQRKMLAIGNLSELWRKNLVHSLQ